MSARTTRKNWISGSREATGGERTSLVNTTVGSDLGAGGLEVHPVLGGASVPFGKDGCEVRVVLLDAAQHGASRDILEGCLEVKRHKDSGGISLRKMLNGLDHRVCTIRSSHSTLYGFQHIWQLIPSWLP